MSRPELPPLLVCGRVERLRDELATHDIDVLLVHRLVDVRWLTGFTGSAGIVLVTAHDTVLITDPRYGDRAAAELRAAGSDATVEVGSVEAQERFLDASLTGRRVGLDESAVTWEQARRLSSGTAAAVEPVPPLVPRLREVKDHAEVARIRAAAAIADAALAAVRPTLSDRPTEADVARLLDRTMEDLGADRPGYGTIVASGPNAALPHAAPGERVISDGDTVIIDVGAEVDGYRSDMTRTFVIGEPDPDQELWLDVVEQAQAAAVDRLRPGSTGTEVHRAAADLLDAAGLGDAFVHGVGHGVGLVIHETPFLARSEEALRVGQVVTVEPGVYLPGRGGVRWEDLFVVTTEGSAALTAAPKDPIIR